MAKIVRFSVDVFHTYPINDSPGHLIDIDGNCACAPRLREFKNGNLQYIHNSWDKRELMEIPKIAGKLTLTLN
jgi:hypothetical protein